MKTFDLYFVISQLIHSVNSIRNSRIVSKLRQTCNDGFLKWEVEMNQNYLTTDLHGIICPDIRPGTTHPISNVKQMRTVHELRNVQMMYCVLYSNSIAHNSRCFLEFTLRVIFKLKSLRFNSLERPEHSELHCISQEKLSLCLLSFFHHPEVFFRFQVAARPFAFY